MFDIFLGIFLFLSPVFFLLGEAARLNGIFLALQFHQFKTLSLDSNIIQFQFFQYGVILLFIATLIQKPLRNFRDKWTGYFLGLCALSVLIYPKALASFTPIFLSILLYFLIVQYAKNIRLLLYPVVIISILNTSFAILQFFKIYFIYSIPITDGQIIYGRYDGLMTISNQLGIYQALALPVSYFIHPLLSIITLAGLLLSKSLTSILAALVGMAYLFYPKRQKILRIICVPMRLTVLLGIFIIFIVRFYHCGIYKISMRCDIWFNTVKEILKKPLIGYGLNNFIKISPKFTAKYGISGWVYNEYLELAFSVGIVSLFIAYMFLKDKFKEVRVGLERAIAASCLTVLIICFSYPALHFSRLTGTIIPVFAFWEILKRRKECV